MSWNYTVHQINRSFDQIASWYREFMHRTEQSFRALHARISYLEDRQAWQGPSDEQVERVLRKILAEKFSDASVQHVDNPHALKDGDYFVERPKDNFAIPKPLDIGAVTLQVDPDGVPSKAYAQTFQMLENGLSGFPHADLTRNQRADDCSSPNADEFKRPDNHDGSHSNKSWS